MAKRMAKTSYPMNAHFNVLICGSMFLCGHGRLFKK